MKRTCAGDFYQLEIWREIKVSQMAKLEKKLSMCFQDPRCLSHT